MGETLKCLIKLELRDKRREGGDVCWEKEWAMGAELTMFEQRGPATAPARQGLEKAKLGKRDWEQALFLGGLRNLNSPVPGNLTGG